MKLKIINNRHGPDSKAWYTLKPLMKYHHDKGIPTMWGLAVGNYDRAIELKNNKQPWLFCDMPYWGRWNPLKEAVNPQGEYFRRIWYSSGFIFRWGYGSGHSFKRPSSWKDR